MTPLRTLALTTVLGLTTAVVPLPAHAAPRTTTGIVFVSDMDTPAGSGPVDDVYLYDERTGSTSRLTDDDIAEAQPQLSPDGRHLAYLKLDGFNGVTFCRLRREGAGWACDVTRRVSFQAGVAGPFAWDPDGRSVVFAGQAPGESDVDIFRADLAGLAPATNLTEEAPGAPAVNEFQPTVSPDGRHVVFTRDGDLWRIRADGTHAVRLTSTPLPVTEFGAEYSPDGRRLAFHSNRKAPSNQLTDDLDVWLMRARPEGPRNRAVDLTPTVAAPDGGPSRERFPSFSPDGSRIAFWWSVGGGQSDLDTGEIYTVRTDGTDLVNLTDNNASNPAVPSVGDISPDWGRVRG